MDKKVKEKLDKAIATALKAYNHAVEEAVGGRMTLAPHQSPTVQHAHGALNALLDLQTELLLAE